MRVYEQNRKWFTDAQAQGVNIWYNETFGGDDVCEIKIMKVKIQSRSLREIQSSIPTVHQDGNGGNVGIFLPLLYTCQFVMVH